MAHEGHLLYEVIIPEVKKQKRLAQHYRGKYYFPSVLAYLVGSNSMIS